MNFKKHSFKNWLILFTLLLPFLTLQAESNWSFINNHYQAEPEIMLLSSDNEATVLSFNINAYALQEVATPNGTEYVVNSPEATQLLLKGAPDLPKLTTSLIIPDKGNTKVEVISSEYFEITDIDIAPSKGNFTRDIDPASVPFTYSKIYEENSFFPQSLADLSDPYILRDFRGQTVKINTFRYNPVTNTLRIYTNITVKVSPAEGNAVNVFNRKLDQKINYEFDKVYTQHFINYSSPKYDPLEEEGNMLILCYSSYMDAMQPFVEWKTQKGMEVEMMDAADAGSTANTIKTFVSEYYADNGLTFLLIVGDAPQVPTNTYGGLGGPSDNAYGYISGDDHYQEIFVGRFSAENTAHVETQVQRVINYEKFPMEDATWYSTFASVASSQGTGDDGEYDYEHLQNIEDLLLGFTYTNGYEYFDGSQGGLDDAGNPTPTQVAVGLNAGVSIVNYTGHGSTTSWSTSGFSNSDVNQLTNDNMLPFIWSVACVNGNFTSSTCFAEAWLRATNGDEPTGAIAVLMSTINQSWDPPMEGQDEMNIILTENAGDNIKRTFGGLSINGCFSMNDDYGAGGYDMTDTWTLFGDPSVVVRTAPPADLTVTHNPVLFIGESTFSVMCDLDGATVALTSDGEIAGTGTVEGGQATVSIMPFTNVGTLTITVTGFNAIPYFADIDIIPMDGPFVTLTDFVINDDAGNGNDQADFGEDLVFDIAFENVGNEAANTVSATISTEDQYVDITSDMVDIGTIESEQVVDMEGVFGITLADNTPDNHSVMFTVNITDDNESEWLSYFSITVNAPVMELSGFGINDEAGGNGNGRLDPGEVVEISITGSNLGHATSPDAIVTLDCTSEFIQLLDNEAEAGPIDPEAVVENVFSIAIDPETPVGEMVEFEFNLTAGEYLAETFAITKKVGLVLEDFETGDLTNFDWQMGGDAPWEITDEAYEGAYALKSADINDSETAEVMVTVEVAASDVVSFYKKVSCEDGYSDDWDYLAFYIDGTEQDRWDGEVDWSMEEFPISAGTHVLKWVYLKDYTVSSGDDCAWIDYIVLPVASEPDTSNHAPEITSNPVTTAEVGTEYSYSVEATDEDGDELTFSLMDDLGWLSLTDNGDGTAVLSGTPEGVNLGEYTINIIVTDGTASIPQSFTLSVIEINVAPYFMTDPVTSATMNVEYEYLVQVGDDNENPQLTLSCPVMPDWLAMEPMKMDSSMMIHGTPTAAGEYEVEIMVTDGIESETQAFTIVVTHPASVDNIIIQKGFSIYPNPVKDIMNIDFEIKDYVTVRLTVYNILGEEMITTINNPLNAGVYHETIDLSNLENGIYICQFAVNEKVYTKKITVNK